MQNDLGINEIIRFSLLMVYFPLPAEHWVGNDKRITQKNVFGHEIEFCF